MIKPIKLTDENGKEYTLEFDRSVIRFAESKGFKILELQDYPMTIYDFFYYAFRKHHPNISKAETDKIIDDWGGIQNMPEGVLERLAELYTATFNTLGDGKERKNAMRVEL